MTVVLRLRWTRLPELVRRLRRSPRIELPELAPERLGTIVDRVLRLGPYRPRCLHTSLVLLRMLRRQGTDCELVIGLPVGAEGPRAHAWIEVDGREVGPPPGSLGHEAMARYGGG